MGTTRSKLTEKLKPPRIATVFGDEKIHANKSAHEEENTIWSIFEIGLKVSNNGPCLGTRYSDTADYEWETYEQIQQRSFAIGSAMVQKGISKEYIAIKCKNSAEWFITALACSYYSNVICTIGMNENESTVMTIIQQGEYRVFIANTKDAVWICKNHSKVSSIELLIVIDLKNETELVSLGESCGVEVVSFTKFEEDGSNDRKPSLEAKPEDVFCVCYTSGSTGIPKGVMITHRSITCTVLSMISSIPYDCNPEDICVISYLPVSHIFEIANIVFCIYKGGRIGFFRGNISGLLDDIRTLRPTYLPAVPRVLNRLYTEVMNRTNSSYIKKFLMDWALSSKSYAIKNGVGWTIWDSLIFQKIRQHLGGNVMIVITTSAPMSAEVKTFVKCAIDCLLYEAYGQTEITAVTLTDADEWDAGHVGYPLSNCQLKLVDVEEMNYFAKDDVGELCARGPCLMKGYYKRDDLTAEIMDKDGWLHTGDIAEWLPNGALKIIDRKKNIFKLSQGIYITPEKVERAYMKCDLLDQIFLDGISTESYCVALVVPNETLFMKWANDTGFEESFASLCDNDTVTTEFTNELREVGKREGLSSLEQARRIKLLSKPFSVEEGHLTSTLKKKRHVLRSVFQKDIQSLYEN